MTASIDQSRHWDGVERRGQETEALKRLEAAIEHSAESVVVLDALMRVEYVNPAFETTTGHTRADVLGKTICSLNLGPASEATRAEAWAALRRGENWAGTYTAHRKDGTTYQEESTVSPVKGSTEAPPSFVAVCRDVTQRKLYEAIAEAVNMMENVGYVFASIRHELGNPINSIKTALTVLQKSPEQFSAAEVAGYYEHMLAEISRVEYLLRALKTFGMHETVTPEPTDLVDFVERFRDLTAADLALREIDLRIVSDEASLMAAVDPRALHQVLLNLLANATDALEGRNVRRIVVHLATVGPHACVRVADTGCGMGEAQRGDLFKPFHTSKPHGTGLGLVIIKKLVTKMNGTVSVTSRRGEGTEVSLLFDRQPRNVACVDS